MKNTNFTNIHQKIVNTPGIGADLDINRLGNIIFEEMPLPNDLNHFTPISEMASDTVENSRKIIKNILNRRDNRFIMIVGPCSIHDMVGGFDYAKRLKKLALEIADTIHVVMRVYFDKPRTNIGWKGFINDPYLDGSFRIQAGIRKARQFLLTINELGLPVATELLYPNSLLYLQDLISWASIGARTVESQVHRELASALDVPVGFKNSTDGSLDAAINGIVTASRPHSFIGLNNYGNSSIIRTSGNEYGHIVLRGGLNPNYGEESIALTETKLAQRSLAHNIIVDCSHGNSSKNHELQEMVLSDIVQQVLKGNNSIVGAMLESNIEPGNQPLCGEPSQLRYGCSVTDACIGWETTQKILLQTYEFLKKSSRFKKYS